MSDPILGGHFMTRPIGDLMMTPERFTEEQRQFQQAALDFIKGEVVPSIADIENKKPGLLRELLAKAGELGLLMADVPEENGGLGLDKTTDMILTEAMNGSGSWAVTFGAQVGIGMLPIVFFGNEAQRARYLPKLSTGEWVGAYALTEAGAGSDALSIRTKAVEDGDHWVLNGTKQWITNAGIADVFTVFAKVDGSKFSAFIVEKGDPGVSIGPEEHKLGLKGSSTCEVILEDCRIPKDRLLGRVGRGHRVAFGILYFGRLKLGLGTLGGCKELMTKTVRYASERKQFDRNIVEFGLIREKLARVAARMYACEAMGYRTSGLIDDYVAATGSKGSDKNARVQEALEEYGIESAILKIYGSELLDYTADEAMQIHGGYGYTEHYDIERTYRDSRINRIFEGTNEINRILVARNLLRGAAKNKIPLVAMAERVHAAIEDPANMPHFDDARPLAAERALAERIKWTCAFVAAQAVQNNKDPIDQRQDILGALAELVLAAFTAESAVQRTVQIIEAGRTDIPVVLAMTRYILEECGAHSETYARRLAACVLEGEELEHALTHIHDLARRPQPQVYALLETIAVRLHADGCYRVPA